MALAVDKLLRAARKKQTSSSKIKPGESVVHLLARKHEVSLEAAQALYDAGRFASATPAGGGGSDGGGGATTATTATTGFGFSPGITLEKVRNEQALFAKARDWDQFHLPRSLTLALVGEVGELCEIFQWKSDSECAEGLPGFSAEKRRHVGQELSDCLLYLLRIAEKCHVDLPVAVLEKMSLNGAKYPADVVRGSSKKYNEHKNAARGL